MSENRRARRGGISSQQVAAAATVGLLLVALFTFLAAEHIFPFNSKTSSSSSSTATSATSTSTTTPKTTTTTPAPAPRADRPVWGPHDVTLAVNRYYPLDNPPIKPLDACDRCVWVGDAPGAGLALQASNVTAWTKSGRPTHNGCADQLRYTSSTAASLVEGPYTTGVHPGGWLCAVSQSGEILRLQYKGADPPGNHYYFNITAWRKH